ncbi:hypothetical protein [Trujillonella endophytica]|uniref:Uncharacterized protein n=1 Tax=Trujillonella endophytica TaxID=673521 RepID=A0A1H8UNH7_9ACTN|nr:hypothetical protein [Trujillella endophytica]SEP04454.1 hypothetical protein SAMN05660991_02953 [Trujillella endophytica]
MSTDIEQRLERAFAAYADLAGADPDSALDSRSAPSGPPRRSRVRRWAPPLALGTAVAAAAAGVFLVVGDGGGEPSGGHAAAATWESPQFTDPADRAEAAEEYLRLLRGSQDAGAFVPPPYRTLAEALPNTRFRLPDGSVGGPATELVVVGRVTQVGPGRGFYTPPGGDEPDTVVTAFDDPRDLEWRTVHAQVDVTTVLGGQLNVRTIVVGVPWGPDVPFEVARDGLPALGEVVLFLRSGAFAYDPSIHRVEWGGADLLVTVGDDGRLALPDFDPTEAERFLAGTPTLDSLRAAAAAPPRILPVPE